MKDSIKDTKTESHIKRLKRGNYLPKSKDDIEKDLKLIEENLDNFNDTDLARLFFDHLAKLQPSVFDRAAIPKNIAKRLQNHLDKEDSAGQEYFVGASKHYKKIYKEARYYAAIGSIAHPSKGASYSYIIQNPITKEKLGIYKPSFGEPFNSQNPYFFPSIIRAIIKFIVSTFLSRNIHQTVSGKGFVAESSNSIVNNKVISIIEKYPNLILQGLDLQNFVPETHIASFLIPNTKKDTGSFQLWVNPKNGQKAEEAMNFLQTDKRYNSKNNSQKAIPQELFDMLAIITYITGDADKKGDNWLVISENGEAKGIRLIDGAWSMHPYHIEGSLSPELNYQHCWKVLPNGKVSFSPLGKEVIKQLWDQKDYLIKDIEALYQKIDEAPDITKKRINMVLSRLEVLTYAAKEEFTLQQLASIRQEADYKKINEMIDNTSAKAEPQSETVKSSNKTPELKAENAEKISPPSSKLLLHNSTRLSKTKPRQP